MLLNFSGMPNISDIIAFQISMTKVQMVLDPVFTLLMMFAIWTFSMFFTGVASRRIEGRN